MRAEEEEAANPPKEQEEGDPPPALPAQARPPPRLTLEKPLHALIISNRPARRQAPLEPEHAAQGLPHAPRLLPVDDDLVRAGPPLRRRVRVEDDAQDLLPLLVPVDRKSVV